MLKVAGKQEENPEFATLFFNSSLIFKPGQFIMLWIPEVDEKPYTLSSVSDKKFGITIEAKGIFSKKAISLKKDDLVGIRGPFGNGFTLPKPGDSIAIVAGGCGLAPLAPLLDRINHDRVSITCIHGARSKDYLLFKDRFKFERYFCTDDGSLGHKGFVTDLLKEKIADGNTFNKVYTCGPEIMMHKVFEICEKHNIHCQVSLERYMRCGFGLCGACVCGKEVVCKDGPVFGSEKLRDMEDFNKTALLKSGKEVALDDYFAWRHP
ncbi:MAG: dihydroorotate dehydrogenase electron transfer subunit [Desulfobacterales bacterium]|nr:dihydroorotate dehydrogenase electron transfer subunit [Desulfobacterales bacterium]